MNNTEKIIYLVATKLRQAMDQAEDLAPGGIDRVKITRPKSPFTIFSNRPEDFEHVDGSPLMLVPFEKLYCELFEMLPKNDET